MKAKRIINTKFCEVYFGLFAPCLIFYESLYADDRNRLAISFILFEVYITLNKSVGLGNRYGFYFSESPHKLIFIWKDYFKKVFMPWAYVLVERQLMTNENDIIHSSDNLLQSRTDVMFKAKQMKDICIRKYNCNNISYEYYVTYIIKRPYIFRNCSWFNNISYEIYTTLDKDSFTEEDKKNLNYCDSLIINTKHNIAIEHLINLNIAAKLNALKPF